MKTASHCLAVESGLLPFIEQNALHANLRLDEPWNSQHNSEFTAMLIPSFGVNADGCATVMFPVFQVRSGTKVAGRDFVTSPMEHQIRFSRFSWMTRTFPGPTQALENLGIKPDAGRIW